MFSLLLLLAQAPLGDAELCDALNNRPAPSVRAAAQARATGTTGPAYFIAGCMAFGDGRADKAADLFEKATETDGTKSLYFDWLGRAYGDQAQRANKLKQGFLARKTKSAFERAVALDANNLSARSYLVDFYQLAPGFMGGSEAKASEQIAAIRSRNPYRGGFVSATAQQRRKDVTGAEREFSTLIATYPDSLAPRTALVQSLINGKRFAEAFRAIDAARTALPASAVPAYLLGRTAVLSGEQLERGEAALRSYLTHVPAKNEPTLAAAHMRLGQLLEKRGQKAEARTQLEDAVRLDPSLKEAKDALARLK